MNEPVLIEGARIVGTLLDRPADKGMVMVLIGGMETRVHPALITPLPSMHGMHRLSVVEDDDGQGQSCICGSSLAPITGMRPSRRFAA